MKKSNNKIFMIIGVLVATAVAWFYLSAKKTGAAKDTAGAPDESSPAVSGGNRNTDIKKDKTSGTLQMLEEQAAKERLTGCKFIPDTIKQFPADTTNIENLLNDEFYARLRQKGINKEQVTSDKILGFFKAYDVEPTAAMLDYLGIQRLTDYLKKDKTAGNLPYAHVLQGSMRCAPLGESYRLM